MVLFVVSILLAFPVLSFKEANQQIETDLFIEEFSSGITLMQNHAITNGEATKVEIFPDQGEVLFRVTTRSGHPLSHYLELPEHINFTRGDKTIYFKAWSGNIRRNGTLHLDTPKGRISFVFQIGSGRFYVKKTAN